MTDSGQRYIHMPKMLQSHRKNETKLYKSECPCKAKTGGLGETSGSRREMHSQYSTRLQRRKTPQSENRGMPSEKIDNNEAHVYLCRRKYIYIYIKKRRSKHSGKDSGGKLCGHGRAADARKPDGGKRRMNTQKTVGNNEQIEQ